MTKQIVEILMDVVAILTGQPRGRRPGRPESAY